MAYEMGGRADKYGNRFEYNWVVCKLLDVIEEKLACVILEALGKDESGVDLWVIDNDGNIILSQENDSDMRLYAKISHTENGQGITPDTPFVSFDKEGIETLYVDEPVANQDEQIKAGTYKGKLIFNVTTSSKSD